MSHWIKEVNNNICTLWLDKQNATANSLDKSVLEEFENLLDEINNNKNLLGLLISSKKKNSFIVGADIPSFKNIKNTDQAAEVLQKGHDIFHKLEKLSIPTVALINGICVGGGLELALACDYRIATNQPSTRLGLPEVMLGIHPGWGGTVRLPRLIGGVKAMDLILSGRTVSSSAAKKMGIINDAVPERQLIRAGEYFIKNQPSKTQPNFIHKYTNHKWARPLLSKSFIKKLNQKISQDHYPAPYAAVQNWLREGVDSDRAFQVEIDSGANLLTSETCKNLVRVFFLQEELKSLGKQIDFKPKHVHVIGAGTMGGDIAAWCALQGFNVTLQDREPKYISPAIKRAYSLYKKKLKKPRLISQAMDRLNPDTQGLGIKKADIIIEAIFENLEAKQELFKAIELKAKPAAILATNTSSIPLDKINQVLKNPERLVGIHFFNPVAKMQLVEVVSGDRTSEAITQQSQAFVHQIKRLPLPVKSSPGFLVNRILMPYLLETFSMLDEGIAPEHIDKAAKQFGMPMGPIELADLIGLDVCLSIADHMPEKFDEKTASRIRGMVESGKLGKKSGQGFYEYKKGKPVKEKTKSDDSQSDLAQRLVLRMVNESTACLQEGVVASSDLLDAGMIFGTGFAPFRGGPMHYAKSIGIDELSQQFQQLEQKYGTRFQSDANRQQTPVTES